MFKYKFTLEEFRERSKGTLGEHLGIEFTAIGDNWLEARMPVDHRTVQPMGLLHGGASAALAETLGSIGSLLCIDPKTHAAVGIEINANHIKSAKSGWVTGRAQPLHLGRTIHVWEIKIQNDNSELVCVSRLTVAIIQRPS
jgi:1,4-dihydroxy-2-naphthoyl-CoA hydrolase